LGCEVSELSRNDRRERQQDKANLSRDKRLGDKALLRIKPRCKRIGRICTATTTISARITGMCGTIAKT
jgi:hypothetical protein